MSLINEMNKEKPAHLKEYDRRMFDGQNIMSLGNVFYKKNEEIPEKATKDQVVQSTSPYHSPQKDDGVFTKYDIVVDKGNGPQMMQNQPNNQSRRQVMSRHVPAQPGIQIEYHGKVNP